MCRGTPSCSGATWNSRPCEVPWEMGQEMRHGVNCYDAQMFLHVETIPDVVSCSCLRQNQTSCLSWPISSASICDSSATPSPCRLAKNALACQHTVHSGTMLASSAEAALHCTVWRRNSQPVDCTKTPRPLLNPHRFYTREFLGPSTPAICIFMQCDATPIPLIPPVHAHMHNHAT
jgi:hypothetical protein